MGTVPLTPLLAGLDPHRFGDGSRPLPHRRLERVAQLTAAEEWATPQVAKALRVSEATIKRARRHELMRARVAHLRQQVADRAQDDSPLALRGNRIALLDQLARDLARQLADNDYEATIAVDKQGNPITGFDRGRVAELVKTVTALEEMTTARPIAQPQTTVGVAVTMTVDQAVTKVQALLSRTHGEGVAPPMPGVPGGISRYDDDSVEGGGTAQGPQ